MILIKASFFFIVAIIIVQAEAEDEDVIVKKPMKHFYTAEAKIDVVHKVASKAVNRQILDKIIDENLEIVSAGGVNTKVKDFFKETARSSEVETFLKRKNQTVDSLEVQTNIHLLSDQLYETFNELSGKIESGSSVNFQHIFSLIHDVNGLINELAHNLNTFNGSDLMKKVDETIIVYKHMKPHQKILNAVNALSIDSILPLFTEVFPNGRCGTKITRTQAIMQFFDWIIVNIGKSEEFMIKCFELKELLTGANLSKEKETISTSNKQNIHSIFEKMMSHVDFLEVPEVPIDYYTSSACILDLECTISDDGRVCAFNINLQDEFAPITITTKDNTKLNSKVTRVDFATSCTLNFIPNAIFKVFINLNWLDVANTKLTRLEPDFFLNATKLSTFYGYSNNIKELKANTFIHAPNLTTIYISNCKIQYIDHKSFEGLTKLTHLYLYNNKIEALSFEVFRPLVKLSRLELFHNNCIDKDFSISNGVLTTVQTELEINTKCQQNDDNRIFNKNQLRNEKNHEKLKNRFANIEISNRKLEEKFSGIEKKFLKLEENMNEMKKMIEKLLLPHGGPIEHNNLL